MIPKTWLVTGASRGLGRAIAAEALAAGHNVVAAARSPVARDDMFPNAAGRLLPVVLDVTDFDQAEAAVAAALDAFGRIDALVNNAGYGQLGHFETVSAGAIERQYATNVFGLLHVTRAVLPTLRGQGAGHIFNLSSIGGVTGFDGSSVYCSTKFAVEGFSESLALELARFGIAVTIVEPGFFRTDFLESSSVRYGDLKIDGYAQIAADYRRTYESYNRVQAGDPIRLAKLIVDTSAQDRPPIRIVAGSDALAVSRDALRRRLDELEADAAGSISTDYRQDQAVQAA